MALTDGSNRAAADFCDSLLAPVRMAGKFGFPLPVFVAFRGDDLRLPVPVLKELEVVQCRGA